MTFITVATVVLGHILLHIVLHHFLEIGGKLEVTRRITVSILIIRIRPSIPVNLKQILILVLLLRVK